MDATSADGPDPGADPPAGLEVVASNAHYMLTRDAEGYDIWAVRSDDDPLQSFPGDEAGADDAMAEFERLTRAERARRLVPSILLAGLVVGALTAVVGTAVQYTAFLMDGDDTVFFAENEPAWWVNAAGVVNVVGSQVGLACLALLLGVYLARRLREPA